MLMMLLVNLLVFAHNVVNVKAMDTIHILPDGSVTPKIEANGETYFTNVTIRILANGSVTPPDAPIQRNDDVYIITANITTSDTGISIERDNIILDGAGFTIQGPSANETAPYPTGILLTQRSNVTIKSVKITTYLWGIFLFLCSANNIVRNAIFENSFGLSLYSSYNNIIKENDLTANRHYGMRLSYTTNNLIYHNNIVHNYYVNVYSDNSANTWDNGYPSGGNYWGSGGKDLFRGPYQNETGSDGIEDSASGYDRYPLMDWWVPTNIAISRLLPDRNAACKGFNLSINAFVQSEGITIVSVNITIYANTTVIGTENLTLIGRSSVILQLNWSTSNLNEYDNYTLRAYAKPIPYEKDLSDNDCSYSDVVTITHMGDINNDKKVDTGDLAPVSAAYGSLRINNPNDPRYGQYWHPVQCVTCPHTPNADINGDHKIEVQDLARTSGQFGWYRP
jgi:parallel beta-helix repeat protein